VAEWVVRQATPADVPGILDTLRSALGETPLLQRTADLWAWKHEHNPFGHSLVLVAAKDGVIAGVRAMMRWEITTRGGETLKCLRPVDTATHPDFLRQGIFRELTMSAIEQARSERVHLVFNTPNEKSAPGYLQMGWQKVADIGVMIRPRLGRAVSPLPDRPPSIAQIAPGLKPAPHMVLSDETPWRDPMGLRTPRTGSYIRWRFTAHPTASYGFLEEEGGGILVARANWRGGTSELVLSDLIGAGQGSIRRVARTSKARYLAGWFSPSTPERRTAILAGMIPVPKSTLRLVAMPLVDLDMDVFDLASWDLTTSDLELL